MKKFAAAAALGAVTVATLVSTAPAASAAPKPGIQAPKTAVVGEEITVKTTFLAKVSKGCFDTKVDWNEPVDPWTATISLGMYSCNGWRGNNGFTPQTDTDKHVFDEPGVYTITVKAGYLPVGMGDPDTAWKPAPKGTVKGASSYTATITVTSPDKFVVAPERAAQILVPGAEFNDRTAVIEFINALNWDGLWAGDVGGPSTPVSATYDVASDGTRFASFRFGDVVKVFTDSPSVQVRYGKYGQATFAAADLPAGGHVVRAPGNWTTSDGRPTNVYTWSTSGQQVASTKQ